MSTLPATKPNAKKLSCRVTIAPSSTWTLCVPRPSFITFSKNTMADHCCVKVFVKQRAPCDFTGAYFFHFSRQSPSVTSSKRVSARSLPNFSYKHNLYPATPSAGTCTKASSSGARARSKSRVPRPEQRPAASSAFNPKCARATLNGKRNDNFSQSYRIQALRRAPFTTISQTLSASVSARGAVFFI